MLLDTSLQLPIYRLDSNESAFCIKREPGVLEVDDKCCLVYSCSYTCASNKYFNGSGFISLPCSLYGYWLLLRLFPLGESISFLGHVAHWCRELWAYVVVNWIWCIRSILWRARKVHHVFSAGYHRDPLHRNRTGVVTSATLPVSRSSYPILTPRSDSCGWRVW